MDALGGNPAQLKYSEMKHIEKYRNLDEPGRIHVDTILQWEADRMEQISDRDSQINELNPAPLLP